MAARLELVKVTGRNDDGSAYLTSMDEVSSWSQVPTISGTDAPLAHSLGFMLSDDETGTQVFLGCTYDQPGYEDGTKP